ncbi:MAG: SDR family oxidoreductase [Acidimicrobiia bacterium]
MTHQFDLTGQTALVTGARRGLGMGIAHGLARAGADIVAVSSGQEPVGSEIQALVESCGRSFLGRSCDFSNRDDTRDLVGWLSAEGVDIDILVNNAGTARRSAAVTHSDDDWDTVLEVNLHAPFVLTRELGRPMVERGTGKVIFVASVLSFQGGYMVPSYTAAKSALAGLTRALANEWASEGVNVNAIAPGYMETEITQPLRDDPVRATAISDRIPAGRWGTPDDLAGPVVFLASSAADYVHGTVLTVDGGWMGR